MIVLDTNIVSEAMKPEPAPAVRDWLDEQAAETLYLSSVTVAELLFGIGALPDGRRKQSLATTLDGLLGLFDGRILAFDTDAARRYADLAVAARNAGRGFPTPDGYTDILRPSQSPVASWSRLATPAPSRRQAFP
jgi:predicted nucleic acid-binding protein